MQKPAAVFLAVMAWLVAGYLSVAAIVLGAKPNPPAEHALNKGVWIAFGAVVIVALCATYKAFSERILAVLETAPEQVD